MADVPAVSAKTPTVAKKETKTIEKKIKIDLIPSLESKLGRAYVNYASISHSPFDFSIRFCEAPSLADAARIKGDRDATLEIPTIIELVMTPNLIPKIIEALKINYEKYQKQFEEKAD